MATVVTPDGGAAGSRVRRTEARILSAAHELFVELGYQDTTLTAVADRAGVGARTVYLRFGSKGTVLLRAMDRALAADVPEAGSARRPTSDGSAGLDPVAEFAAAARLRHARLGGLVRVLIQASATEPFVADALRHQRAADRRAAAALIKTILPAARGASQADRDASSAATIAAGTSGAGVNSAGATGAATIAAETVTVLASAETWLHLTESAGWSAERYQNWLVDTIRRLVSG